MDPRIRNRKAVTEQAPMLPRNHCPTETSIIYLSFIKL